MMGRFPLERPDAALPQTQMPSLRAVIPSRPAQSLSSEVLWGSSLPSGEPAGQFEALAALAHVAQSRPQGHRH